MQTKQTAHTTPVNKHASIFLSRKKRVETVREALEIFAGKITAPEVADNIIEMMKSATGGQSPALKMTFMIHRDMQTPNHFVVKMKTSTVSELGDEHFLGLQ